MFEKLSKPRSQLAIALSAGAFALTGCGSAEPKWDKLPEGAKAPVEYRYEVIIGESGGSEVYLYTDSDPQIEMENKKAILSIDGETFCPDGDKDYEGATQNGYLRDNYCSKDVELYQGFTAIPEKRVSIIDRGEQNAS